MIEVKELLIWLVPFLVTYAGYLHKQVINNQVAIAVNSAKDDEITKQYNEFKKDIKKSIDDQAAEFKELRKEIHDFMLEQKSKNNG